MPVFTYQDFFGRPFAQQRQELVLGFVASTQPTHDAVLMMGNQSDMICKPYHYQVFHKGWSKYRRIFGPLIYLDIIDDKIMGAIALVFYERLVKQDFYPFPGFELKLLLPAHKSVMWGTWDWWQLAGRNPLARGQS